MSDATPPTPRELDPHELLRVIRAMQRGDLTQRMPPDLSGVGGEIAAALNAHLEQSAALSVELRDLAQDLADGKFGRQIETPAEGNWFNVRSTMNFASTMLAAQARALRQSIEFLGEGNLNAEMRVPCQGEMRTIRDRFNQTLADLRSLRAGIGWLADELGARGQLGGAVPTENLQGEWRAIALDLSKLAQGVTRIIRNSNAILSNLNRGRPDRRVTEEVQGEFQMLKQAINELADRLDRTQLAAR